MQRDVSPSQWTSPGTAQISLVPLLSAISFNPVQLDSFSNNFSPTSFETVNLASGFNAIAVPDLTNCRGVIIVMPRGNSTSWTMKGVTGDTGLPQNPNGFYAGTFVNGSIAATIGITTGGVINGVTIVFW